MSRPIIGSKYTGPAWDRPALRQMPPDWKLDEPKDESVLLPIVGCALGVLFAALVVAQVVIR